MSIRRFLKETPGKMAIMLSLAAVPLLIGAGAAFDTIRATHTQTLLQEAADAAVIADGTDKSKSGEQITKTVKNYLTSNSAVDALKTVTKIENGTTEDGHFYVRIIGKIDTNFMAIAGISSMNVGAYSEMNLSSQAATRPR